MKDNSDFKSVCIFSLYYFPDFGDKIVGSFSIITVHDMMHQNIFLSCQQENTEKNTRFHNDTAPTFIPSHLQQWMQCFFSPFFFLNHILFFFLWTSEFRLHRPFPYSRMFWQEQWRPESCLSFQCFVFFFHLLFSFVVYLFIFSLLFCTNTIFIEIPTQTRYVNMILFF